MTLALRKTMDRLRGWAGWSVYAEHTDRQLLECFSTTGDEGAFAALVQRHGPLVLGVCRRVLGNAHDAEDAFQATFLVLARRAGQLPWRECIKNWLHGVAYRVSMKARRQGLRRKEKERKAQQAPPPDLESTWEDLRSVLDEELSRLPAKYRAPLLLCYLEGKTRDEAAEELGWSPGSVKGRLERGRELLRSRLVRRGLPLSAVLCASFITESAASAAVPAVLAQATVQSGLSFSLGFAGASGAAGAVSQSVLNLAQGVLNAMLIAKLKMWTLGLVAFALLGAGGFTLESAVAERQEGAGLLAAAQEKEGERKKDAPREKDVKKDGERKPDAPREKEGKKDGERKKDGDREQGVRVLIKGVDVEKGTLRVTGATDGDRGERTYNLAGKDVKVSSTFGQPLKLSDLREGNLVFLQLNDLEDVVAIRVQPVSLRAALGKVDADKNQITVRMERDEKTLDVGPDARLTIAERAVKLDAFKEGDRVILTVTPDRTKVLVMYKMVGGGDAPREGAKDGERKKDGEREGDGARPHSTGVITGMDLAKNQIEVLVGTEGDSEIRTFEVSKTTTVTLRAERMLREITVAELSRGIRVGLHLSNDRKTVTKIDAMAPFLRTVIKSVDIAGKTITACEKTLKIMPNLNIIDGRKEGTLEGLKEGLRATLYLTPDRSQVIAITVVRGDGEREE